MMQILTPGGVGELFMILHQAVWLFNDKKKNNKLAIISINDLFLHQTENERTFQCRS